MAMPFASALGYPYMPQMNSGGASGYPSAPQMNFGPTGARPYFNQFNPSGTGSMGSSSPAPTNFSPSNYYGMGGASQYPMGANPFPINGQQPIGGGATFQQGVTASTPSSSISPQFQTILDSIQKQQDYANVAGTSAAQSLAAKRGLAGSSIEQFGTDQAIAQNSMAAQNAIQSTLSQNAQQQSQMQQLQAQGYFNRANTEATTGAQLGTAQGQLTSDEIASQRNLQLAQQQMALQQSLGQQGLGIQNANIDLAKHTADQNSRNALLGTGSALLSPYLLPSIFGNPSTIGQGGGVLSGLFGGGGAASAFGGGMSTASAGSAAAGASSSLFPGGVAAASPGASGLAGFGAGSALAGLGGYYAGSKVFGGGNLQKGDQGAMNVGSAIGGVGGSLFGPAGSAAGAFLGSGYGKLSNRLVNGVSNSLGTTAGEVVRYANPVTAIAAVGNKISSAVSSVFPF